MEKTVSAKIEDLKLDILKQAKVAMEHAVCHGCSHSRDFGSRLVIVFTVVWKLTIDNSILNI